MFLRLAVFQNFSYCSAELVNAFSFVLLITSPFKSFEHNILPFDDGFFKKQTLWILCFHGCYNVSSFCSPVWKNLRQRSALAAILLLDQEFQVLPLHKMFISTDLGQTFCQFIPNFIFLVFISCSNSVYRSEMGFCNLIIATFVKIGPMDSTRLKFIG